MKIAITGASGKTGYRISEEAVKKGYKVRQIIRKNSKVSEGLERLETIRVSLDKKKELDKAFKGIDALVIATGARASLDLTGPAKVDALGVYRQLESCKRVGIKRVVLVSSLCTGKLFHSLNLFGFLARSYAPDFSPIRSVHQLGSTIFPNNFKSRIICNPTCKNDHHTRRRTNDLLHHLQNFHRLFHQQ